MQYKIRDFQAPQVLVEYISNDGQRTQHLNVRIDKKLDGTLPQGKELDQYILSYAPDLDTIRPDPYADIDWSAIEALVEPRPEEAENRKKVEAQQYLFSTDWYVTRFTETGVAVPEEVSIKRAEARAIL